ncbi:hypothetical protein R1flu_020014 [Riccia fluitans]|uniref:Uncharacterized protein n=1 Tax=Riccia fluitans TaxID=41844 RepID=A0ABD1ZKA6_9MARC
MALLHLLLGWCILASLIELVLKVFRFYSVVSMDARQSAFKHVLPRGFLGMDHVAGVPLEPLNMWQVLGRNQPLPDDDDPIGSQIPMSQIPPVRFSFPNCAIGSLQPSWEMSGRVLDSMLRENDEAIADAILCLSMLRQVGNSGRSSNAPFGSLSKTECKDLKLPLDFLEKWLEILDSFYRQRASINPPCMRESTEVPNVSNVIADVEDEGAGVILPIDFDRGATSQAKRPQMSHNDRGVRQNTSKQKKNTSMSATAIVDAMGHFTSSFVATEER